MRLRIQAGGGQAVVLLSGGMDSVAALLWARRRYKETLAVMFDYGQPNRDQELTIGGMIAESRGIRCLVVVVADTLPRGRGILRAVEDHDGREDGLSPAFVTGRNLVFAASAASHGCEHFANGSIALVVGFNTQDAKRFPDCHPSAVIRMGEALRCCLGREVQAVAPWIDRTKAQILQAAHPDDLADICRSWSCYRKAGPCGSCSACVLRAVAFREAGIADACASATMVGGDPARCW